MLPKADALPPWATSKIMASQAITVVDDNPDLWVAARAKEAFMQEESIVQEPFGDCDAGIRAMLGRHTMVMQHSKRWHKLRLVMLTASNAPMVMGSNPYCSRERMFQRKTGQLKLEGQASGATVYGNDMEKWARAEVVKYTGLKLIEVFDFERGEMTADVGLRQHPDYPWLGASPDGIFKCGIGLEIKCPHSRPIHHLCPLEYYAQVQVQMEVCDLEMVLFAQFRPPSITNKGLLDLVVVKRDRDWFAKALEKHLKPFWDNVVEWHAKPENGGRNIAVPRLQDVSDDGSEPDVVTPSPPPPPPSPEEEPAAKRARKEE